MLVVSVWIFIFGGVALSRIKRVLWCKAPERILTAPLSEGDKFFSDLLLIDNT